MNISKWLEASETHPDIDEQTPSVSFAIEGFLFVQGDAEIAVVCRSLIVKDSYGPYARVIDALGNSTLLDQYEEDDEYMFFGKCEVSTYIVEDWQRLRAALQAEQEA